MKSRNKVLSLVIAVIMGLGIIALPAKMLGVTLAASSQTATVGTDSLSVINVDKRYDLSQANNQLVYYDYCTTPGAEVVVWAPTGELERGNWHTYSASDPCAFTRPGLYAMQFRLSSNGFYTYSDVIYIPVSDSLADINFNSELKSEVKPGTVVTIPTTTEQSVAVKVYSPYGEEIEVQDNKFTNISNILGTYYIEYSISVLYEGIQKNKIVYKTITFSNDSVETNAVKEEEKTESEEKVSDYKLVVTNTDLYKEEKYLYLYKYYNLASAYVLNPNGDKVNDAEIFITVYDDTAKKYYNFTTGEFETSTSSESKRDIKTIGTEFILRTIDNLTSMEADGHLIKVTYTTTYAGKNLEQVIDKTERFNFNAITASAIELSPSEVTDIVIKEKVEDEDFNLGVLNLSGVKLTFEKGYDEAGLKALISTVNFSASNSLNGSAYTSQSSTPREDGKEGIDVIDNGDLLANSYKFYYNTYATKEFHFVMAYSINFKSLTNSDFSGTKRIEFKTYARESSKDAIKPYDLTVSDYVKVVTSQSWQAPTVKVSDMDNDGNQTTGANIALYIIGSGTSYTTKTQIQMGEMVEHLSTGVYTVTIEATDYVGNTRVKTLHFEVKSDDLVVSCPSLTLDDMMIEEDENTIKITGNTNAEYVIVYTVDKAFSPKTTYTNGGVSAIEFEMPYKNDLKQNCVAVFVKSNAYGTVYKAVKVWESVNEVIATSVGFNGVSSSYKEIVPNSTIKANVFDKLIWFGNSTFSVECLDENGKYTITDGNELTFITSGTYTIKSVETVEGSNYETETTITVSDTYKSFSVNFPIGQQQVAKKGDTVAVSLPCVEGYYGYNLDVFVTDSKGNIVASVTDMNNPNFVASKTDVYSINYKLSSDAIGSQTKVIKVSTGNTSSPTITISAVNENVIWTGETIKYIIQDASSIDKNGQPIDVRVYCYDANGNAVTVKTNEDGKKYVEVKDAGIYTIYYTSVDADGIEAISKASFAVEFPEEEAEPKISVWGIIGIVLASVAGVGLVAFVVIITIKQQKKKTRFINKTKQVKKQEKQERETSQSVITVSETKDEKHWLIKKQSKLIGKENNKIDAIKKAKELDKSGTSIIKVYNKNGRLVDSL